MCDTAVTADEIKFLCECTKFDDLRIKYMSSCIGMIPNLPSFVRMLQNNDSDTTESDKVHFAWLKTNMFNVPPSVCYPRTRVNMSCS